MHTIKYTFNLALLSILMFGLTACGGGGKRIVTQDDSADYKSATSLPPLKKPSLVASSPVVAQGAIDAEVIQKPTVEPELSAQNSSEPAQPVAEPVPVAAEEQATEFQSDEVDVSPESLPEAKPQIASSLSVQVVAGDSNSARLEIDADFDAAWSFVTNNLKSSDVTVFSRNKAAGRFSVGCGEMESAPTVEKKGGWSFFNKAKRKRSEYCALSVVERRGKTFVFVLNRDDTEVADEYSKPLFARILNN